MLSSHEQQIWDDIERFYAAEAEEPVPPGRRPTHRGDGRGVDDLPAGLVAGVWSAILLIIFGAVAAGLAVGAATALGWLLWRRWPLPQGEDRAAAGSTGRAD